MLLPDEFLNSMTSSLKDDIELQTFLESLTKDPPVSVRINTKKWKNHNSNSARVPWCEKGFYLSQRPVFTLDPIFHAGGYYVQEASSMFIWHILESLNLPKSDLKILDLSAAPGGKSTLIASWLDREGLLVANEIVKNRAYTLKYNLMKEGYDNTVVTNNPPGDFKNLNHFFDIILLDAPCSGEGMFRKDPDAVSHWSTGNVQHCATRQKSIIEDIIPSLKPGGILIYSTCTYNHFENIDNADFVAEKFGMVPVKICSDPAWCITEIHGKQSTGYQFYPHKTLGEGFFVSVLRSVDERSSSVKSKTKKNQLTPCDKKENQIINDWVHQDRGTLCKDIAGTIHAFPARQFENIMYIDAFLRLIYCGVSVGVINKNILLPDHSLALSQILNNHIPKIELEKPTALKYLKKSLQSIDSSHKSWMVAAYDGLNLGFLKNIGDRINNYLPNEYRILMELPE